MGPMLPTPGQFFFVQRALRVLFAGLVDWHVTGLEQIPRQGPVLVALNHTSFLDVVLPAMFFSRPIVSFAKIEVFRSPFLGPLFRWMRMVPVCRGEVDRDALRHALRVLQGEGVFAVAPEGTRTPEGKLIRAKPGVALLAAASRAPVLPLAIWGATRGGFAMNLRHLRRTRVEAVIGEPLRLREGVAADHASRQAIADDLMLHIARLLPEESRGYYAHPADFPTRYFEPLGPRVAESPPALQVLRPSTNRARDNGSFQKEVDYETNQLSHSRVRDPLCAVLYRAAPAQQAVRSFSAHEGRRCL